MAQKDAEIRRKLEKVFVYGTLRKGMGNHRLLEGSGFLGMGETVAQYGMYVLPGRIPYVKRRSGMKAVIVGEVYEVDEDTLRRIDRLEGHPDFYRRRLVPVMLNTEEKIRAWLYFLADEAREDDLFIGGDYVCFIGRDYI
ncbi:MAG TPA: gamma-glutamylcyclotransferase [Syntrophorhabdus sp.]|nr:gamma-glutamylcyclotransferase [Syntrophorhabdus sp.]